MLLLKVHLSDLKLYFIKVIIMYVFMCYYFENHRKGEKKQHHNVAVNIHNSKI